MKGDQMTERAKTPFVDIADPAVRDGELCGRADIAAWLRVSVQRLDAMRRKGLFPEACTPAGIRPRWTVGTARDYLKGLRKFVEKPEDVTEGK